MAVTEEFRQAWLECEEEFGKNIEQGDIPVISEVSEVDMTVSLPAVKFKAPFNPQGGNVFDEYRHVPVKVFFDKLDVFVGDAEQRVSTAVSSADSAASEAREAAGNVQSAVSAAQSAAQNANSKAELANNAASSANTAAQNASSKATLADNAATNANSKATLADQKATLANDKAALANTAATNANTKAALADEKATLANQKATLADTAATNANNKASLADEKATYAKNQGDYAKEQGDYAKTQGNRAKGYNDHPWSIGNDGYIYVWDESTQAMKKTNKMIIDFSDLTEAQKQAMAEAFYSTIVYATVAESQAAARELT